MKFQLVIAFTLFLCLLISPNIFSATEIRPESSAAFNSDDIHLFPKKNLLANINKGDFRIGGGLSFGYSTYSQMIFSVYPNVSYFLFDNLAVGIDLMTSFTRNSTFLGIGPSVTYYFANNNKWSYFAEQAFNYVSYEDFSHDSYFQSHWNTRTSLGANYFFIPYIGFGPILSYVKPLDGSSEAQVSVLGNFSIYF